MKQKNEKHVTVKDVEIDFPREYVVRENYERSSDCRRRCGCHPWHWRGCL